MPVGGAPECAMLFLAPLLFYMRNEFLEGVPRYLLEYKDVNDLISKMPIIYRCHNLI